MKLLSFFFAVIVLLESTVMVSCIEDVRHAGKDNCCAEACEAGKQDTDDGCDSGCNPFQHCGCCKGANVLDRFSPALALTTWKPAAIQDIPYEELLSGGIHLCPDRPPRG